MIDFKNVTFSYSGSKEPVLKDLSLSVKTGEIFGLLGPSGAGKSTTQRIAMGLENKFSGTASVLSMPAQKVSRHFYNSVGVCFELPALYLRLTALENLKMFASLYDCKTLEPMSLLEKVGLEEHANKKVSDFSKGMKMRLNLCRSLINDPELLFLDEPTTGQDPARARLTRELIVDLNKKGKTIFLTTHNMAEADEICDRVGFLVNGSADVVDNPAALKLRYGEPKLLITTKKPIEGEQKFSLPVQGLKENATFSKILEQDLIETMHTQEASLDDVFVRITEAKNA